MTLNMPFCVVVILASTNGAETEGGKFSQVGVYNWP